MKKILLIIMVLTAVGCSSSMTGKKTGEHFAKHYEMSSFQITEMKRFSVEMVVKGHELSVGENMIDLIVHDRNDRDVVGAEISVVPWMPSMGHGVMEKPRVVERGGGLYTVENVVLNMGGEWELRVSIDLNGMTDAAVFVFRDVLSGMEGMHENGHDAMPDDLDLSREKMSENGMYHVSYMSELHRVPLNRIHTWRLRIHDETGNPVYDASVAVGGDMPEHGHGLPTRPEVTDRTADGEYVVEGMKFSMPGWWVVEFNIATPGGSDRVSFNLMLK